MRRILVALLAAVVIASTGGIAQPLQKQKTVEWIKKEVRHELLMLPYYGVFDWLEAEITDPETVVLRGQVIRPSTKSEAEDRVSRIEGIDKVVNEIEILPLSSNDNRLRRQIYRALFHEDSALFQYGIQRVPSIHILVRNGRVTLKGVVTSKADSDYAYIRTRGVPGSFEVINELQIETSDKKRGAA